MHIFKSILPKIKLVHGSKVMKRKQQTAACNAEFRLENQDYKTTKTTGKKRGDKMNTGNIIKSLRESSLMTQTDLTEKLHGWQKLSAD